MLYFAYAANLNRSHMARLCPGAKPLYAAVLEGYTLTARRWFNIEPGSVLVFQSIFNLKTMCEI